MSENGLIFIYLFLVKALNLVLDTMNPIVRLNSLESPCDFGAHFQNSRQKELIRLPGRPVAKSESKSSTFRV